MIFGVRVLKSQWILYSWKKGNKCGYQRFLRHTDFYSEKEGRNKYNNENLPLRTWVTRLISLVSFLIWLNPGTRWYSLTILLFITDSNARL